MIRSEINEKVFLKNVENNIKHLEKKLEETKDDLDQETLTFILADIEARKMLLENNVLDADSFEECYANELAIYSFIIKMDTEEKYVAFFRKNYQNYLDINLKNKNDISN